MITRRAFVGGGAAAAAFGARAMTTAGRMAMLCGRRRSAERWWGLCFEALEDGVTVNMQKTGSPPAVSLETSPDAIRWLPFDGDDGTTPVTLARAGDRVYFRAGPDGNGGLATNASNFRKFVFQGSLAAFGSVMSLLDPTEPTFSFPESSSNGFRQLFHSCTSLTRMPDLPATATKTASYALMFYGCTSLRSAVLPNVAISNFALTQMFAECSALEDITVGWEKWPTATNMQNWVRNVAATGTFRCPTALGTDATITRSVSRCPVGWTVVNTD